MLNPLPFSLFSKKTEEEEEEREKKKKLSIALSVACTSSQGGREADVGRKNERENPSFFFFSYHL